MEKKPYFFRLIVIMAALLLVFSCKQKNSDADEDMYDILIHINFTDPEPSAFDITGEVNAKTVGSDVTFTGTYHIGQLTYTNIVFHGTLDGNKVTMNTDSCQVQYTFNDTVVTEDITWNLPPFTVSFGSGAGGGDIVVVKHPMETTESGTFSFTVTRKD